MQDYCYWFQYLISIFNSYIWFIVGERVEVSAQNYQHKITSRKSNTDKCARTPNYYTTLSTSFFLSHENIYDTRVARLAAGDLDTIWYKSNLWGITLIMGSVLVTNVHSKSRLQESEVGFAQKRSRFSFGSGEVNWVTAKTETSHAP